MNTSPAEPDFGGRIGRTIAESEPWWPEPAGGRAPNVVMIVLDDTGFAHLGCYGSTLATPNIDRLAGAGLRYSNFHTTALCSPTRACLLTGRNHHTVGMRGVSNWNTGFPHQRGGITSRATTVAEALRARGYATYAAGKWHLAPMEECSSAGPHHNWPLQKGFDRYYGFLQGEADHFSPELTHDNHHIDPPATPDEGYHLSEDLVDRSTGWIRDLISVRPDRPFFLYLAFGAMHAPHHAPAEHRERWRGRFDEGYEVWRERWFDRQLAMGIIPPDTELAPRNPGVPAWDELTENQQRFSARLQEAFAAMLEHTDEQIGRLTAFLESHDLLDDTLLLVLSDNGASREGGAFGVMDEWSWFNGMPEDIDDIAENRLDDIGGPHSHSNYPWGWAQAGNSPLPWYKSQTYGGGVRDPLVVHWPGRVGGEHAGAVRTQFCHAVDIAATILDAADAQLPEPAPGGELPLHGRSLFETFDDAAAPPPRSVQYFEQMGHRGIWHDGWKATTFHFEGTSFDDDHWALYHLDEDFSEQHDLSSTHPEKLRELVDLWWQQAEEMGVLPLDDRTIELFFQPPRPGTPHSGDGYTYHPPMSHLPADVSPRLGGQDWEIHAEVEVGDTPLSGVLYSRGSHNIGQSFFVADGRLTFDYNALGHHTRASAPIDLDPGVHRLSARFESDGEGGILSVAVNGTWTGGAHVPKVIRLLGSTGSDIGRGPLTAVVDDLDGPSPFTGRIQQIRFEPVAALSREDTEAGARAELATE